MRKCKSIWTFILLMVLTLVFIACETTIDYRDVPTGLRIADYDNTSITLAWDSVSGADGYHIYLNSVKKDSTPSTSYRVSGLSNFTTYTFGVSAYKGAKWPKGEMESGMATESGTTGTRIYTVTFDSNDGSINHSQRVTSGTTVSRPGDPSREGYTFNGWYADSALSKPYDFSAPVRADITLYAKWTALARHTVRFEWNNGSEAVLVSVYSGQKVSAPETPNRTGYTFAGWYSNSNFTALYDFSRAVIADITLYAQWDALSLYTVTFNTNDGSRVPPESVYDGGLLTRPADPNKTGYAFDGWYRNSALTALYNFSTPVTGNITLYAKWAAVCIVTFDTVGGNTVPAQTVPSGRAVTRPADPSKGGHTFDGWYREAVYNNLWNFNTDTVNYDTTLYAKWITNQYTVSFETNGGSPAPSAQTVKYGDKIREPPAMTKTGYAFGGWYTEASFTSQWNFASNTVSERTTLYAKWAAEAVEMVRVSGGSFQMGTGGAGAITEETPLHAVTMSGFYISKYEITQAQYQEVMGVNPSYSKTSGKFPVENVSWLDAIEFCNKLSEQHHLQPVYTVSGSAVTADFAKTGYRLPTEAQWEYAAKGGGGSPGNYTYAGSNNAEEVAWYSSNSAKATHVTGTKPPNGLGIYDMSGNVSEWCWDWYGASYYSDSPSSNPSGPAFGTNRVTRGGSYNDNASSLRSAARAGISPSTKDRYTGFRVVCP